MFDDAFLGRQQEYYNARAPEYDEWWDRRGRYDYGAEENGAWFAERDAVYAALDRLRLDGDVLELACGTGIWTLPLSRAAACVTAVDGSAEMLAVNRARVQSPGVRYVQADLFTWEPPRTYDAVVFGFWLSHVPPGRLPSFLGMVRRALRPGGQLFFVDSRRDPVTTTADQPLPDPGQPWLTRRLNDGREYCVIKLFYGAPELEELFARSCLPVRVRETARFFIYGTGGPDTGRC
jgi:SAM-dependent methyltransferase